MARDGARREIHEGQYSYDSRATITRFAAQSTLASVITVGRLVFTRFYYLFTTPNRDGIAFRRVADGRRRTSYRRRAERARRLARRTFTLLSAAAAHSTFTILFYRRSILRADYLPEPPTFTIATYRLHAQAAYHKSRHVSLIFIYFPLICVAHSVRFHAND